MPTSRRRTILGLGGLLAAGGAVVSTGAFDTVEAERSVGVETAGDASAFLGLEPAPDQDVTSFDANDLVEFDLGEIPVGSRVTHGELVHATNQGTQTVTSLKFEFLVDSPDLINGGDDHQDDEDVAEALRIVSENEDGDIFEIDAEDDENLIAKSDAGDAGNNELAPGEYIPFGIRVDLNDAPIDEISGAQDITLRIIAESGDLDGEPENGDDEDGTEVPDIVFTEEPNAEGNSPNISFTIENNGDPVSVDGFRIRIENAPPGNDPESFEQFNVADQNGLEGGEIGDDETYTHEPIDINGDEVSYKLSGFEDADGEEVNANSFANAGDIIITLVEDGIDITTLET